MELWKIGVLVAFISNIRLSVENREVPVVTEPYCVRNDALVPSPDSVKFLSGLLNPISFEKYLVDFFEKQPIVLRRKSKKFYSDLLNLADIDEILLRARSSDNFSTPMLDQHGKDWKLVKRIQKKGEWWTGVHNYTKFSLEDIHKAVNTGFTLVINQRHSGRIFQAVSLLEDALGYRTSANLYLSPVETTGRGQGFEAHFDWMDGLVLQVYGSKNWTVYDPPAMPFPRPDLVFRPPQVAVRDDEDTAINGPLQPQEFVLQTGDFMYLPRGIAHEARASSQEDPAPSLDTARRLSLHITIGIEVSTHYSVEMLIHHLILSHKASHPSPASSPFCSDVTAENLDPFCLRVPLGPTVENTGNNNPGVVGGSVVMDGGSALPPLLHILVSFIGSLKHLSGSSLLRRGVGVNILTVEVPSLSPWRSLETSIRFIIDHIEHSYMKRESMGSESHPSSLTASLLEYLIDAELLRLCVGQPVQAGPPKSSVPTGQESFFLIPEGKNHGTEHLAADFNLKYLWRFLSRDYWSGNFSASDPGSKRDWWMELWIPPDLSKSISITSTRTFVSSHNISDLRPKAYAPAELKALVNRQSWRSLDENIITTLLGIFSSVMKGHNDHSAELNTKNYEVFCKAWTSFMADITSHKQERQNFHLASLEAAGERILEKVLAKEASNQPLAAKRRLKKESVRSSEL